MTDALPALLPLTVLAVGIVSGEVWRSRWWHDRSHQTQDGLLCDHCLARFLAARRARLDAMYRESRERWDEFGRQQHEWLENARRETDRIMDAHRG